MKLILQLLLTSLIWTNSTNSQIFSTIGLYENIVNTHENGNPMEIDYFNDFGYELTIKQKRYFYESGKIKAIGYYLTDNKVSWKYFNKNGDIINEEITSQKNNIKSIIKLDENLKKKSEENNSHNKSEENDSVLNNACAEENYLQSFDAACKKWD